jgi:gluconolactonase
VSTASHPDGKVTLLDKDLKAPNGIAFSPDEKILYVNDSIEVNGGPTMCKTTAQSATSACSSTAMTRKKRSSTADGMKVDEHGTSTALPRWDTRDSPSGRYWALQHGGANVKLRVGEMASRLYIQQTTKFVR